MFLELGYVFKFSLKASTTTTLSQDVSLAYGVKRILGGKDDPDIHVYVEPFRFRFIVVRFSSRPSGVEKKGHEGDTRGDTYPRAIIFTRLSPLDPCVILRGRKDGGGRSTRAFKSFNGGNYSRIYPDIDLTIHHVLHSHCSPLPRLHNACALYASPRPAVKYTPCFYLFTTFGTVIES